MGMLFDPMNETEFIYIIRQACRKYSNKPLSRANLMPCSFDNYVSASVLDLGFISWSKSSTKIASANPDPIDIKGSTYTGMINLFNCLIYTLMPQKYDSLSEETTLIAEKRFFPHFRLSAWKALLRSPAALRQYSL